MKDIVKSTRNTFNNLFLKNLNTMVKESWEAYCKDKI